MGRPRRPETARPRTGFAGWWHDRRGGLLLGAIVFVVHAVSPSPQVGDSRLSVVVAWQLATTGSLDVSAAPAVQSLAWTGDLVTGPDGALLPFFPWPPMLLALPGAALIALFGVDPAALSISEPNATWIVEVPTASLLVAMTAAVIRRLVMDGSGPWATPAVGWLASLSFAFTTIAWSTGSRALWQQTVSMLTIALLLLAVQRRERAGAWPLLAGVLAALALVVRPTNVVIVLPLALWLAVVDRPTLLRSLVGALGVMAPFAVLSLVFYGSALPPYYLPSRLAQDPVWDLGESLAVHLVSPGRGLFLYVPVAILAGVGIGMRLRSRTLTGFDVALSVAVIGQLALIAKFGSTNGFTYGPRLLLDIVPVLVLLAAPALRLLTVRPSRGLGLLAIAGVTATLAWGLFINASGAVSRAAVCWNVTPETIDVAPHRVWDWSDPPFLRPWNELATGGDFLVGHCPR